MSIAELLKLPKIPLSFKFDSTRYSNKPTYDDLVNAESELGRTIFGPIPDGYQREFFMAKSNVWIWHESGRKNGVNLTDMTIRYEVRPTGVYKKTTGSGYTKIEGDELENFRKATKAYLELVKSKLYC